MHFFIHRFIYVHITLRARIIQIYQIQEMGHKSGFVLLLRNRVVFGIYKSSFLSSIFCEIAKHLPTSHPLDYSQIQPNSNARSIRKVTNFYKHENNRLVGKQMFRYRSNSRGIQDGASPIFYSLSTMELPSIVNYSLNGIFQGIKLRFRHWFWFVRRAL